MQASAQQIAATVSGRLIRSDVPMMGPVVTDSRGAQAGSPYIVRHGGSADGHAFVFGTVTRGVVVVIVRYEVNETVTQVVVEDSTEAPGPLARAHIEKLRSGGGLDTITMTGSVSKTTTKNLLLQITSEDGPTVVPKLSLNNEIGLPLTVLLANETIHHLVLETGASGPGHITYLTDIAAPDVATKLCAGHTHVNGFGGFESVAAAKAKLIKGTRPGSPVTLSADNPNIEAMTPLAIGRVIRFSASDSEHANVVVCDVRLDRADRTFFILMTPEGEVSVGLKIVGRHHVANALTAAAGALTLEVGLETVASVLSHARAPSPHCMGVRKLRVDGMDLALTGDSYNANLDSVHAGIAILASIGRDSQHITTLGEILELGEDFQSLHQQVDALTVDTEIDTLIGPGADTRYYLERALEVPHREAVADPRDTTRLALEHARDGAIVLVEGPSGSQP